MQVSISSITIPPRTPGDLHQKFAPTLGLLHPSFCLGGGGFFGIAPEGRAFVYKRFLPFLEFPLYRQELATDNTLGSICCYEILCFEGKLFNLKIEPKLKNQNNFSDQRLRMRNSLIVRHLILGVLWTI